MSLSVSVASDPIGIQINNFLVGTNEGDGDVQLRPVSSTDNLKANTLSSSCESVSVYKLPPLIPSWDQLNILLRETSPKHVISVLQSNNLLAFISFATVIPYLFWSVLVGNAVTFITWKELPRIIRALTPVDTIYIGTINLVYLAAIIFYLFDGRSILNIVIVILFTAVIEFVLLAVASTILYDAILYTAIEYAFYTFVAICASLAVSRIINLRLLVLHQLFNYGVLYLGGTLILAILLHFVTDFVIVPIFVRSNDAGQFAIRTVMNPIIFRIAIAVVRVLVRKISPTRKGSKTIISMSMHNFNRAIMGRMYSYQLSGKGLVALAAVVTSATNAFTSVLFWRRKEILEYLHIDNNLSVFSPDDEFYADYLNIDRTMEMASIFILAFLKILNTIFYREVIDTEVITEVIINLIIQLVIELANQVICAIIEAYYSIPSHKFQERGYSYKFLIVFTCVVGCALTSWEALYLINGVSFVEL